MATITGGIPWIDGLNTTRTPKDRRVGDCAIRACCKATNRTWNEVFDALVQIAYQQKDVVL